MSRASHSIRYLNTARSSRNDLKRYVANEIKRVEEWWSTLRYINVKRPYSAADVVKHRGSLPLNSTSYPSSLQANKLFELVQKKFNNKEPLHTLGVIDPLQMSQLARCEDIHVAYVSGWACSATIVGSTNEVSPDFGDYPYNTVPNQVERIFKAQQMHDKKQFLSEIEKNYDVDTAVNYLKPIIADGDMGHGGVTTVMKLAKLFAEKGAAGIHLEDQLVGGKRCGHLSGAVLVPTSTHLSRLIATRFQWDLMGTENLIIARTDSCNAKLISSTVDSRDHEHIKGIIKPGVEPWSDKLIRLESRQEPPVTSQTISDAEAEWYAENLTYTFDEAVEQQISPKEFGHYKELKAQAMQIHERNYLSLNEMKQLCSQISNAPVYFNWDSPRTMEGHYIYDGCMKAAIKRSLAFVPYSDMIWLETKTPDVRQARDFAKSIHDVYPETKLVYNLSPSFNWRAHGYSSTDLKNIIWNLAEYGFVLQLVSLAGIHSNGLSFSQLSRKFQKDGMKAYVESIQDVERAENCDILTHQKWSGAEYVDSLMKTIQNGSSSRTLSTSGENFTESQF